MPSSPERYRVVVTPVEKGGLPCTARCSIEFEQPRERDWMALVEQTQRLPGLAGDERIALVVAACLLDGIAKRNPSPGTDPLHGLRAPLADLLSRLQSPSA